MAPARPLWRRAAPVLAAGAVLLLGAAAWLAARAATPCPAPNATCAVPRFSGAAPWAQQHAAAGAATAPTAASSTPRAPRVAIVALAREADAGDLACTLRSFDGAYNGRRRHPYVIMSEEPWSARARAALEAETDARVLFVVLPASAWSLPRPGAAGAASGAPPRERGQPPPRYYGDTDAYRKMCRFFSGPFFQLPALAEFDFYWRLDAHVRYICDIDDADDPVALLARRGGVYAFGIVMQEQMRTVPSLWGVAAAFAEAQNASAALRSWGHGGTGGSWARGCHFWSNLEVGSLAFFRGAAYQQWFAAADAAGGFVDERWGDAPVHTLGLMMLAPRSQVLYLPELGYQHPPNFRCPRSGVCRQRGAQVPCRGDPFAGCMRDIADGIAHDEGCALDDMLQ